MPMHSVEQQWQSHPLNRYSISQSIMLQPLIWKDLKVLSMLSVEFRLTNEFDFNVDDFVFPQGKFN